DRGRDGAGQPGVGARKGEVEFALIAARAEVEIDAVEPGGRRELPPSRVLDRVGAGIARDIAVLESSLGCTLDAPIGAAHNFGFLARRGEPVLHSDRYGAAERVDPIARIVGPQR